MLMARTSDWQQPVGGILLLYHHPPGPGAPTVMDHVEAFERHSRFAVWSVNTAAGFPAALTHLDFRIIVLHYSLGTSGQLDAYFRHWLERRRGYKVAFFQDEHHFCQPRFEFLNQYGVDCVYTLLEPRYWDIVYRRHTRVRTLLHTIPGYVPDGLVELADELMVPDAERGIDIGYRGRTLAAYMGRGAREKAEIGVRFAELAQGRGLTLDIAVDEDARIYGDDWFRFLADCRGVLGVEAGVSVFDLDDSIRAAYDRLVAANPAVSFDEVEERILAPYEDNVYYRTISPRHFEAAALRVCQILFEGSYSGILEPMVHYIPLRKDFSNLDEVLALFQNPVVRRELTENAHADLISSDRYGYRRFIADFDEHLLAEGFTPDASTAPAAEVRAALDRDRRRRAASRRVSDLISRPFPGRSVVRPVLKPLRASLRQRRFRRWEERVRGREPVSPRADGP